MTVQPLNVSVPELSMPPPKLALPPARVRPESPTVAPESTTRTLPVCRALTVKAPAPGPSIVRSAMMAGSGLSSTMVPLKPGAKLIVSPPNGSMVLANSIASRSDVLDPSDGSIVPLSRSASVVTTMSNGPLSKAPMSTAPPLTRGAPRWSVVMPAGISPTPPFPMAGLPESRAMVWVGPPLGASAAEQRVAGEGVGQPRAAAAVADQVVRAGEPTAVVEDVPARVARDDRVVQDRRAVAGIEQAAGVSGR